MIKWKLNHITPRNNQTAIQINDDSFSNVLNIVVDQEYIDVQQLTDDAKIELALDRFYKEHYADRHRLDLDKEVAQLKDELQESKKTSDFVLNNLILQSLLDEEQKEEIKNMFPTWEAGSSYNAGNRVFYEGKVYQVLQSHNSQNDWKPNETESLYSEVLNLKLEENVEVINEFVEGHRYEKGDKMIYEGKVYKSIFDGLNVWSPTDYPIGWQLIEK